MYLKLRFSWIPYEIWKILLFLITALDRHVFEVSERSYLIYELKE